MFFTKHCDGRGGILLDTDGEIGRMGASLITTWWIEEAIHQQMQVELVRWQSAGEEGKNTKLQALILDAWITAEAGILGIALFQLPPLVNCLRARGTQKQINFQDEKFRQCRLFHSNHWKCKTKQKILTISLLLYFPHYLKLHTVSRVPTSAAFSETVMRRTCSQDETWEHQLFVWLRFRETRVNFSHSVCICLDYFYLPNN